MSTSTRALRKPVAKAVHDPSDETLLLRYRQDGDRSAFETLVQRYERELYSYLLRYLGDATLAEDTFQTTFLQVHLKCDQFDGARAFRPWLYTVATHQAIDAQRRNRRHQLVSLDRRHGDSDESMTSLLDLMAGRETAPTLQMEETERRDWVRESVARLPESLRAAVNLIYYQGLKYREAADVLAIPVGTVKSRLHAAILKLNEAWTQAGLAGEP